MTEHSSTGTEELLPCPFCGGEADTHCYASGETIKCDDCGVETELADDGAAAAVWNARAPAQQQPAPDGWAFAQELSDALLKVRPLGGSELFVKRNGQYYADPVYCGRMIEELRDSRDKEIRARIRAERTSTVTSTDSGSPAE